MSQNKGLQKKSAGLPVSPRVTFQWTRLKVLESFQPKKHESHWNHFNNFRGYKQKWKKLWNDYQLEIFVSFQQPVLVTEFKAPFCALSFHPNHRSHQHCCCNHRRRSQSLSWWGSVTTVFRERIDGFLAKLPSFGRDLYGKPMGSCTIDPFKVVF